MRCQAPAAASRARLAHGSSARAQGGDDGYARDRGQRVREIMHESPGGGAIALVRVRGGDEKDGVHAILVQTFSGFIRLPTRARLTPYRFGFRNPRRTVARF